MNQEIPDVQAGFSKGRGTRDQIANIHWIIEKPRKFQKNFCFIDYTKAFDCVDHNKLENSSRDGNTRPPYLPPEKSMYVKKQQLELDMEQWTGSKLGKEYIKAVYCHPDYLTYMQSTSFEMLGWMKHKLESRLLREITSAIRRHPYGRKWRGTKEPLDESDRGEWKSWLKTQHSKNEDHGIRSHHFMGNRWGNNGNSDRLFSWAPKSLQMVTAAINLRHLLLGRKAMTNLDSILKSRDITAQGPSS